MLLFFATEEGDKDLTKQGTSEPGKREMEPLFLEAVNRNRVDSASYNFGFVKKQKTQHNKQNQPQWQRGVWCHWLIF